METVKGEMNRGVGRTPILWQVAADALVRSRHLNTGLTTPDAGIQSVTTEPESVPGTLFVGLPGCS